MLRKMSKTSPTHYWTDKREGFPILGKLADIVFAIPTSSAASERAWNIFEYIHTKNEIVFLGAMWNHVHTSTSTMVTLEKEKLDLALNQSRPECVESD